MRRVRVYFDASVIIAALLSQRGGSALLFEYIKRGRILGLSSQTAIDEVLEEDKTKRIERSKEEIEQFIAQSGLLVREIITVKEIAPYKDQVDIDDAHLIAGAKLTKSLYLVTLDKKHLLREDIKQKFLPLKIVSPKELLEKLNVRIRKSVKERLLLFSKNPNDLQLNQQSSWLVFSPSFSSGFC